MNKDFTSALSFILGNESGIANQSKKTMERVDRKFIINSAMFWDSKRRVQKIKTLFMNSIGLKQFDDVQDFKVSELQSIELLSLSKNHIIHLHPISQLTTLVSLNVSFNKIYDLNPLSKLQNLQQLYASNNEVNSIEPLKQLKKLKILHVYNNKINDFKETFQTIMNLTELTELDFDQNPMAEENEFVDIISNSFSKLKKLNGQLNKPSQKIKQMSSSKGFMNTSMKGFGTTSALFNSSSASTTTIDPQKSFYNFCKKKSLNSQLWERIKEKQKILQKLENHYKEIDEDFQKEIVKNVRLKNRLYKMIENKKSLQNQKEDNSMKNEEIKQLKRKVKALKEQLFTKDKKGELLRKIFQIQVTYKSPQFKADSTKQKNIDTETEALQNAINQIKWTRRFEADEVIVIQNNEKYLSDEVEQMSELLNNIDSSIRQMKSDIDYLS